MNTAQRQDEQAARMGLEGREPVGAVLRVGRKDPVKGNPTDNDKFFIVNPHTVDHQFKKRSGESYGAPMRELHPDFKPYNNADGDVRTAFRGVLVGATREECFRIRYGTTNAGLGGKYPQHPDFKPSCSSDDAKTATRLYQIGGHGVPLPSGVERVPGTPADEIWGCLSCPAEKCQYRQGDAPRCKAQAWLYFMPRWVGGGAGYMPECLMRLWTGSGISAANMLGFFQQTDRWAADMGLESYSLIGLPFILKLTKTTSRKKGRQFPIITMAHDGQLAEFFAAQKQRLQLAGGRVIEPKLLESAQTADPNDLQRDAVDATPSVPGRASPPAPAAEPADAEIIDPPAQPKQKQPKQTAGDSDLDARIIAEKKRQLKVLQSIATLAALDEFVKKTEVAREAMRTHGHEVDAGEIESEIEEVRRALADAE